MTLEIIKIFPGYLVVWSWLLNLRCAGGGSRQNTCSTASVMKLRASEVVFSGCWFRRRSIGWIILVFLSILNPLHRHCDVVWAQSHATLKICLRWKCKLLPTDYRCRTPTTGHEERETERETGRGVEIIGKQYKRYHNSYQWEYHHNHWGLCGTISLHSIDTNSDCGRAAQRTIIEQWCQPRCGMLWHSWHCVMDSWRQKKRYKCPSETVIEST